jgi:tetratricopeptide (TPR) repeat protein
MKQMLRLSSFAVVVLVVFATSRASALGSEWELRQYDEVYFRDGPPARGVLIDTDKEEEKKIRDLRTQTVRIFNVSEVKEIRRRATQESELTRLSQKYAGRPDKIYSVVCKEAMERFDAAFWPKLIPILEKEAGSKNTDVLALLTELYLLTGQPNPALKHAETLVAAAPNSGRAYVLRGKAYAALEKPDIAGKDFEQAFKLSPEDQDAIVARADFLLAAGKPDEARQMFDGALKAKGNNIPALIGKGMVLLRQGQFPEAEQSFNAALEFDPKQKQAKLGLAATKILLKQYDEAFGEAKSSLNLDNKPGDAFAIQAFAKLMSGTPEALKEFNANLKLSLEEKPNQPRLLLAAAVALEREAKFIEAAGTPEAFKEALAKRNEANTKYTDILNSDPPDAYLQYFIGERKFRSGDYAAAEKAFLRVTKLAPNYAPGHAAVGAVSLRLSKWEKAKEAYTQAIKLDGSSKESGDYYAGKGLAWLKVKQFEEASAALKQAREIDRRNVMALCGLGYIANGEKNKESAVEFFQQALAADGSCDFAADALRKIFAQDNMNLEYVTFGLADDKVPFGWRLRPGGSVKANVLNGQVVFAGVQGSGAGNKVEVFKEVKADDFVRIEADLDIAPTSQVTCGLHIASATNSNVSFEMEFGKDETNEIKVRKRDFSEGAPQWQSVKIEWPTDGRVRLGIDTEDLKTGKVNLWVNGKKAGSLTLVLQKPGKIIVGAYIQAPPKEDVNATVDNIVLVTRGPAVVEKEGDGLQLNKDDEKKPAPEDKKPPEKEAPKP